MGQTPRIPIRPWAQGPYGEPPPPQPYVILNHDGYSWGSMPWCWEVYGFHEERVASGRACFRLGAIHAAKKALKEARKQEERRQRPEEKVIL